MRCGAIIVTAPRQRFSQWLEATWWAHGARNAAHKIRWCAGLERHLIARGVRAGMWSRRRQAACVRRVRVKKKGVGGSSSICRSLNHATVVVGLTVFSGCWLTAASILKRGKVEGCCNKYPPTTLLMRTELDRFLGGGNIWSDYPPRVVPNRRLWVSVWALWWWFKKRYKNVFWNAFWSV